jgi:hypothetical protein
MIARCIRPESPKENPGNRFLEISLFSRSLDYLEQTTKDKYLIADCEEKAYYLCSHTHPKGFSHGKSNSR